MELTLDDPDEKYTAVRLASDLDLTHERTRSKFWIHSNDQRQWVYTLRDQCTIQWQWGPDDVCQRQPGDIRRHGRNGTDSRSSPRASSSWPYDIL